MKNPDEFAKMLNPAYEQDRQKFCDCPRAVKVIGCTRADKSLSIHVLLGFNVPEIGFKRANYTQFFEADAAGQEKAGWYVDSWLFPLRLQSVAEDQPGEKQSCVELT